MGESSSISDHGLLGLDVVRRGTAVGAATASPASASVVITRAAVAGPAADAISPPWPAVASISAAGRAVNIISAATAIIVAVAVSASCRLPGDALSPVPSVHVAVDDAQAERQLSGLDRLTRVIFMNGQVHDDTPLHPAATFFR